MDTNEGLTLLNSLLKDKAWFHEVSMDNYGRFVVYAYYINPSIEADVPDKVANRSVLLHFAASKMAQRSQFAGEVKVPPALDDIIDVTEDAILINESVGDLTLLTNELDRLEKLCGTHILQDIFYEIHDGKNAVTNLSAKFPDVRRWMEDLYDAYGFDVIYEEMDG
jgi:hypothetical protein